MAQARRDSRWLDRPNLETLAPLAPPPWGLGPGFGVGASWRSRPSSQRQHRAIARASDATIVPSLEASTSALSRNFSIGNHLSGSFSFPNHTPFTHDHNQHRRRPLNPTLIPQPSSFTLPQTVKHPPGAKTTRPNRHPELQDTHGNTCSAIVHWFPKGVLGGE